MPSFGNIRFGKYFYAKHLKRDDLSLPKRMPAVSKGGNHAQQRDTAEVNVGLPSYLTLEILRIAGVAAGMLSFPERSFLHLFGNVLSGIKRQQV